MGQQDRSAMPLQLLVQPARQHPLALPIVKLGGVPILIRARLKVRSITTCGQLLIAAGRFDDRAALAHVAGLSLTWLTNLVRRADLTRVRGVGLVYGRMLGDLGVSDVATLIRQDGNSLHERLRQHNAATRLARRAPMAEEVADWIDQARSLPPIVTYEPERQEAAS